MAKGESLAARGTRLVNRAHAWRAGQGVPAPGFVAAPEPRTIGRLGKGRQLIEGTFLFAGQISKAPGSSIWEVAEAGDGAFASEIHGGAWLDDLAAVGDRTARATAQAWVWDWIARYGHGIGPGWRPELAGRRLIRWINHAVFLLRGRDEAAAEAFYASLSRQTRFLSRRWKSAPAGLARIEALTGLIHAALSLEGMTDLARPALAALAKECRSEIGPEGEIPSRCPEELLGVFTLLVWASQALAEAEAAAPAEIDEAIARIAPTLRALRHADGGLARFHGGGRGMDGRLDHGLAIAGVRGRRSGPAMGFARLAAGRTTLIADASPPPTGAAGAEAHASTLAIELTSGRRPVIVNCGPGTNFGPDWRRAGRATPSHSTLAIEGWSSARLVGGTGAQTGREVLEDGPDKVPVELEDLGDRYRLNTGHNAWQKTHGLTHARILDLSYDGRSLLGEDLLTTLSDADRRRFDRAMAEQDGRGIPVAIRFHLHPDVSAEPDMGGTAVALTLKSGEVWLFRHSGDAEMHLEPSVYLDSSRLRPRATSQVVLSGRAMTYSTRIRWSLAKAQETPDSLRDLAPGDLAHDDD
ncbi:heparinase II/III family protein [Pseudoroseicyclus tamaricis]|uniref:Heparinase n=1 Tax=Pseudoroseicyclus tamaricis TaxID=2705421 RepID=A0A6B2K158_9RHOB|nr:heparinase II/III family protein [Pseudoroseicyclus tamaricis]NDV02679.1 heparinase [Pseudoroseicyclus tamaricis]